MIEKEKKEKKQRTPHVKAMVTDLIPIIKYHEDADCFCMKDGTHMDILKIVTKDLLHASDDEIEYDIMKYAKFYKIYPDDIKVIAMNFPCNTQEQQQYFRKKMNATRNIMFKSRLEIKLNRLIDIEKNRMAREFYVMFFSKTLEENYKNRNTFLHTLAIGNVKMIEVLTQEKKEQILFKLNNMCSMI